MTRKEIWKNINNFEGYQVSNFGRIKNIRNLTILKPAMTYNGYEIVCLSKKSKTKKFRVNRLVAEAFIPNPSNYPIVNHKDGNKLNNNVNNLEWCTHSYNLIEAYRLKLRTSRIKSKKVKQMQNNKTIKIWNSTSEIEKTLGYSSGDISQVCNKKRKSAYGYKWEYLEKGE